MEAICPLQLLLLIFVKASPQMLLRWNYTLAKNPEVSSQEFGVRQNHWCCSRKYGMDVTYEFCDLPTAFKGLCCESRYNLKGRLAILCEYDALPEVGHACGHSASGSMSVLAALTLHKMQEEGRSFQHGYRYYRHTRRRSDGVQRWIYCNARGI